MRKPLPRAKLIQLIHVARHEVSELQDEDTYRAMLLAKTGKNSCRHMRDDQLQDVLEHLKKSGFKVRSKAKPSRPLADDAESKKIRALWLMLHQLGAVRNPSEEALAAYAKRLTGVDALQWLNGDQTLKVIESMKKWAMRFLPAAVKNLVTEVRELPLSVEEKCALNGTLNLAFTRGTFDPMWSAWEMLLDTKKHHLEENVQ